MDEPKSGDTEELRARLVAALLHPVRSFILVVLAERSASAREIATEIGTSSDRVGHQLRRMRREGIVRLEERKSRRGVAENYYRAALEPFVDDEEFERLTPPQRRWFSGNVMRLLSTDARRALHAGTFDSRSDACLAHIRMRLDEPGWTELAKIHREAFDKVLALRRSAAARIEQSGNPTVPAASTIICFELPDLTVEPTDM